ncbi:MAG: ATP-dependent Clp protease adapter ClpS [Candidatus Eutrophobiaceae bacterium]
MSNDATEAPQIPGLLAGEDSPELETPPLYQVLLLNDDYTPMDYVVFVLQCFFAMSAERANHIMMEVHSTGRGICGVFTHEIAETKVNQVNIHSRGNEHPLLCIMERI